MSGEAFSRVLVIDDDRDLAESVAELLEARGHKVSLAFTGRDGVDLVDQNAFDLVLLDIEMPEKSGVDTFLEIRKKGHDVPIALMTGASVEQHFYDALESGTLCLLRPRSTAADVIAATRGKQPRCVVLVSDNVTALIARIQPFLSQQHCTTVIARSSDEGLKWVSAGLADCLVFDQPLSSAAGLYIYLSLRRSGPMSPTILVTLPNDAPNDAMPAIQAMTADILKKPFDPEEVLTWLERRAART
jgi:DNA-binding response OmpR family regulator